MFSCNMFDPELEDVFDEMPGTKHSDIVRQLDKEDCPECVGTGNFYDGDFLPCDACDGTGFKK